MARSVEKPALRSAERTAEASVPGRDSAQPTLRPVPPRAPPGTGAAEAEGFPPLDLEWEGDEHRQFPRARLGVPFAVWIGEENQRRFSATLVSGNLSVSGAFLTSTFFLPVGTELWLSFKLSESAEAVRARAEVIRQERLDPRSGKGRSGIAVRFVEFFGQTEVTLARLFLGAQLHRFADNYLQSARAKGLRSELERVVDALAAWELSKVTKPTDPWHPEA